MKNNDIAKTYRTRFIINLIAAAFITCLIESLLIFNIGRLISVFGDDMDFSEISALMFVFSTVLLFAFIFWLLQRRSIDYISEMSETMRELSEGNFEKKLEIRGNDEFSQMAENLNELGEDMKALLENERMAEKSKSDLITNIAHDLRTPLTSIIGYLELLSGNAGERLSAEQKQKYLSIAFNKAKRLEQLISDLFDFTKLSYGKMTMKIGYVDIVKLLEQLLEEAYPSFAEKGLSYELKTNIPSLEITADGGLIARLFDNLISNAIKYGADGKRVIVRVNAELQEDVVEVKVINYGFTIDEKDLPLIFNKFYRADKARSTQTGGTGLGLAIVKDIVGMHGGSITAKSDLNGTVFTVRLRIHFEKNSENIKRI
ncbi:MAG: HAMP domain-containing sensor histidine kinase [Eubacteriales bacterium]|nr:HAMP domain-containing sensor histidine kinase [Eubacteriales bacterium]